MRSVIMAQTKLSPRMLCRWRSTDRLTSRAARENSLRKSTKRVHNRLSRGETVVVDATNLRQRDRLAIVDLAPPDIQVVYEVWTSCNPCAKQGADPVCIEGFYMHGPVPARAHDLRYAFRIIPVILVQLHA